MNEINEINDTRLLGGYGTLCNRGTQYHFQNRIYAGDIALSITATVNPYYVVYEDQNQTRKDSMMIIIDDAYNSRNARIYGEYAPSIRAERGGG